MPQEFHDTTQPLMLEGFFLADVLKCLRGNICVFIVLKKYSRGQQKFGLFYK
jgi:hypothetical protein